MLPFFFSGEWASLSLVLLLEVHDGFGQLCVLLGVKNGKTRGAPAVQDPSPSLLPNPGRLKGVKRVKSWWVS